MHGIVDRVPPSNTTMTWHTGAYDHTTNDSTGSMFIINVNSGSNHLLLNATIDGLCIGLFYEFSAYVANAVETYQIPQRKVRIEVVKTTDPKDLLANVTTDLIQQNSSMFWKQHSVSFNASAKSVLLSMIAQDNGESGSCVVIDDIELRICSTTYSGFCPTG
ncbi:unnamed protein product [Adineta steineri]|uniref:Uncharacterized protein n=1 Tax=Adineta steineri TaxID=433720 RepID=A0A813NG07_9BILA|nr:unnamed protein product [Adineta steineri]CAF4126985.1 unnamed protein product [Adineta steineri]